MLPPSIFTHRSSSPHLLVLLHSLFIPPSFVIIHLQRPPSIIKKGKRQ